MAKGKNTEVLEDVAIEDQPVLVEEAPAEETVSEEVIDEITELLDEVINEDGLAVADDEVLVECVKSTSIPKLALVKGETYLVKRDEIRKLLKHGMVKEVE
jgi:hypothetical protein